MTDTLFLITVLLFLPYALLIVFFAAGWRRTPPPSLTANHEFVSVIVAMRNEAHNIAALLDHLAAQQYPEERFEVIIADDYSQDHSPSIVKAFACAHPHFRLISNNNQPGKKAALQMALRQARGSIVITTDADCTMQPGWMAAMTAPFVDKQVQMVIGPVHMVSPQNSLFGSIQSTEFMSLTGTTGGAAYWGHPVMCNGANLAYRRDTALLAQKEMQGKALASGDDVFLLHAFKKICPKGIVFCKNTQALVCTSAAPTLVAFIHQRMRWASKATAYKDFFTLTTGLWVATFNLWFAVAVVWALVVNQASLFPLLWVWGIRFFVDGCLLWEVADFLKKKNLLVLYPFLLILYPFYSSITLLLSLVLPNSWKNRAL